VVIRDITVGCCIGAHILKFKNILTCALKVAGIHFNSL